jgi:hypothetical protein
MANPIKCHLRKVGLIALALDGFQDFLLDLF